MKWVQIISLVSLLSLPVAYAQDDIDPLSNVKVSKEEIFKSLENLKSQGQISADDYEKAKLQLSGMDANQIEGLNQTAVGMVRNNPDKAVELSQKPFNEAAVKEQLQELSRPKE